MGVGVGLYMYDVVVKKFTFAISSPDEFLYKRSPQNVPPLTCYNFDIHDPITIIFGTTVTEKVGNKMMLCFPTSPI